MDKIEAIDNDELEYQVELLQMQVSLQKQAKALAKWQVGFGAILGAGIAVAAVGLVGLIGSKIAAEEE